MTTYTELGASMAARAFFYPSLLFNLARQRLQEDWHWCDMITENVMLGAIPFVSMLDAEFQQLDVKAVVTLNEEFEIFISPEQYAAAGIAHLHLPTIDFLYAPPVADMHQGVDFIAEHAARGELVYVHCKAGRGRSTSLVLCYLIKHHHMAPAAALDLIRSKRQQVRLSPGQWRTIEDFWRDCGCPGADAYCALAGNAAAIEPVTVPQQLPDNGSPAREDGAAAAGLPGAAAKAAGASEHGSTAASGAPAAAATSAQPFAAEGSQQQSSHTANRRTTCVASGFSRAATTAAVPTPPEPASSPTSSAGADSAQCGSARQPSQPGSAAPQPSQGCSLALKWPPKPSAQAVPAAGQPGSAACWLSSRTSSACGAQQTAGDGASAGVLQTAAAVAADAAAFCDGRETPPFQDPQQPAARARKCSAGSSPDMERSASLVWVSAPSMDLGDCQSACSCGVPTSGGGCSSVGDAADATDARPAGGGCCRDLGSIEVAADYADTGAAHQGGSGICGDVLADAGAGGGGSCKPPGFSWYQSMLPQNWVGW